MVNTNKCGSRTSLVSCVQYFSSLKLPCNLTLNYLKSWTFHVDAGVNNLTINETDVYYKGSFIFVTFLDQNVKIGLVNVSNFLDSDYAYDQENLTKINSLVNYRLCLKAITTRYYFIVNGWFQSNTFLEHGNGNMSIQFYDKYMNIIKSGTFNSVITVLQSKQIFV